MLSVILPAYNEAETIESATRAIVQGLRAMEMPFELRIINNGSTDGSEQVAVRLANEMPEIVATCLGDADYGAALRLGLLEASGEIAVIFNVDYFDLNFLHDGLERLGDANTGPAMVLASKRVRGARDRRPMMRRAATAVFNCLLRLTMGMGVSDSHGMKVLHRHRLEPVVLACRMGTDLFDTELVLRCERAGLPILELPVTVEEMRPPRTSLLRRVPRTLRGLSRLRSALRDEYPHSISRSAPGSVDS